MGEHRESIREDQEALNLSDIAPIPLKPSAQNIEAAQKETDSYERLGNAKADAAEEYVKVLKQDREERGKYADKLFNLICTWLIVISLLIIGSGYKNDLDTTITNSSGKIIRETTTPPRFELSDKVLLALIGGTTASILGLFVIVANYLFKAPPPPGD